MSLVSSSLDCWQQNICAKACGVVGKENFDSSESDEKRIALETGNGVEVVELC